jgi:predicted RNase H-like HicB family nuclease
MTMVHVSYRYEDEGWWAESPDVPGWTAAGESFREVREMARAGIIEFLGEDTLIEEQGVPISSGVWELASATFEVKVSGNATLFVESSTIPRIRSPRWMSISPANLIPDEQLSKELPDSIQKTG